MSMPPRNWIRVQDSLTPSPYSRLTNPLPVEVVASFVQKKIFYSFNFLNITKLSYTSNIKKTSKFLIHYAYIKCALLEKKKPFYDGKKESFMYIYDGF